MAEKHERTDRSDTDMDTCTEAGEEAGTSQSHSRHKKGNMSHIHLTDLVEKVIVDL